MTCVVYTFLNSMSACGHTAGGKCAAWCCSLFRLVRIWVCHCRQSCTHSRAHTQWESKERYVSIAYYTSDNG